MGPQHTCLGHPSTQSFIRGTCQGGVCVSCVRPESQGADGWVSVPLSPDLSCPRSAGAPASHGLQVGPVLLDGGEQHVGGCLNAEGAGGAQAFDGCPEEVGQLCHREMLHDLLQQRWRGQLSPRVACAQLSASCHLFSPSPWLQSAQVSEHVQTSEPLSSETPTHVPILQAGRLHMSLRLGKGARDACRGAEAQLPSSLRPQCLSWGLRGLASLLSSPPPPCPHLLGFLTCWPPPSWVLPCQALVLRTAL